MTDAERNARIRKAMAAVTARLVQSPEEARAFLVREGIHTPDGKLTPEYGGRATRRRSAV